MSLKEIDMTWKLKIPHTYVIVFAFIILAAMLTWMLPGGEFDREQCGCKRDFQGGDCGGILPCS